MNIIVNKYLLLTMLSVATLASTAQTSADSLLQEIGVTEAPATIRVYNTFKSPRVINAHSVEMLPAGVLDFRILHRFGMVSKGFKDMFGLDQATMRMGFDYGITKDFTVGVGRSTLKKELDAFVKYRITQQAIGYKPRPVSIVAVAGITCYTTPWANLTRNNLQSSRLAYYGQLLVAHKLSEHFSLQLAPTLVHRNLVEFKSDDNSTVALGIGTKARVSRRVCIILDAFPILSGARPSYNTMPLSVGVDIETGGHVFQLHFSNTMGMNEKAFVTETTQKWSKSEFQFGFNLSRVFTIKKNKSTNF